MVNDKAIGALILAGSIAGIVIYLYLIIVFPLIVLQITAFVGIALLLGILAWIGYTMATTPPPAPLEPEPAPEATEAPTATAAEAPATEEKEPEKPAKKAAKKK